MDNLIDGRALAASHEEKLSEKLKNLGKTPNVVSILIGDDPSSVLYTNIKQKKAAELGIEFEPLKFSEQDSFDAVGQKIKELNEDKTVNGIMIQLPIPENFLKGHSWTELTHMISPEKDVDGLTPNGPYLSATAKAVVSILQDEGVEIKDKQVVIIGKSDLVGKPIARELTVLGGKISIIDRSTQNPEQIAQTADILISAAGSAHLVKKNWVKDRAVVIDVGTTQVNGEILGDVDFENVKDKASKITPPKGGVGPMTVISLMENALKTCQ